MQYFHFVINTTWLFQSDTASQKYLPIPLPRSGLWSVTNKHKPVKSSCSPTTAIAPDPTTSGISFHPRFRRDPSEPEISRTTMWCHEQYKPYADIYQTVTPWTGMSRMMFDNVEQSVFSNDSSKQQCKELKEVEEVQFHKDFSNQWTIFEEISAVYVCQRTKF